MKKEEMLVAAIKNGTVIDHIPSSKLFQVVRLLHLEDIPSSIIVGYNLKSQKMGRKSIIKVSNKYFSDAELNLLSVVAPNVSLCIIKDFEVVEKKCVRQSEVYHQQRTYADAFPCERPRGWRDTLPLLREGAEPGTRETREQLIRNKDAP